VKAPGQTASETRTNDRFLHNDVNVAIGGLMIKPKRHPFRGLVQLSGKLREFSKMPNAFRKILD
jgi:hypothetical protein